MPLLGCIADDLTGAVDLGAMLVRNGMRTVLLIGIPALDRPMPDADAVVVALPTRTAPAAQAVSQSLEALVWLRDAGCRQFFFRYSPTFDSTEAGNIGPVGDALANALGCGFALACPAAPDRACTVYQGHLFVGATLLHESGMARHPLTPMTDANLVRVLGRQTPWPVGLVPFAIVEHGPAAVRDALTRLKEQGRHWAIVDALGETHLRTLGTAVANHVLVTGSTAVATGLPENFRRAGLLKIQEAPGLLPPVEGASAVIAGSCARATLAQVGVARGTLEVLELDLLATPDATVLATQALAWTEGKLGARPVVIATSALPDNVSKLQRKIGREAAATLVETALAAIAEGLVTRGVRRMVVAGGGTSAALVNRLGVTSLRIGREIAPGVPWTLAESSGTEGTKPVLLMALKGGDAGVADFFPEAFAQPA